MITYLLLIIASVIVIMALTMSQRSQKSYFDGDVCESHCFRDKKGRIMDVYDCCECRAITTNEFEPNFHMCMCDEGFRDFCYVPVTNLLLSQ